MFSSEITSLPVWGEDESYELLPYVHDARCRDDVVIPAMLRMLLRGRVADGQCINYMECGVLEMDTFLKRDTLTWINKKFNPDDVDETRLDENNWKRMTDIEQFISSKISDNITIFVNKDLNSALIYAIWNNRLQHTVAFFIPRLFPALFSENRPTQQEMQVMYALLKPTPSAFIEALKSYAQEAGLYNQVMAKKVANATKIFMRAQLVNFQNEVDNIEREVNDIFGRYKRKLEERTQAIIRLEGARTLSEKGDDKRANELFEFIIDNPHIHVERVTDDGRIDLTIENYLDQYDADGFELFGNDFFASVARDTGWTTEDTKLLLRDVFSADPTFRIRTCGYYELSAYGTVSTERGYGYNFEDRIPNPHLQFHACLGQNTAAIAENMKNGNLVAAIMQCNASTMSVNVHETGATFRPFCQALIKERKKVLEASDGKRYNAKEALELLKKRQEEEQAE